MILPNDFISFAKKKMTKNAINKLLWRKNAVYPPRRRQDETNPEKIACL